MKCVFLAALLSVSALSLGCAPKKSAPAEQAPSPGSRFVMVSSVVCTPDPWESTRVTVIEDTSTGVEYMIVQDRRHGSVSVIPMPTAQR